MRGCGIDATYRKVTFDSFVKFVNWLKENDHVTYTRAHYNGTQTCGEVEIGVNFGYSEQRALIMVKAAELFKLM